MGKIEVTLFRCVRVTHNSWATEAKLSRSIQILLAYLLMEGQRPLSRDVLMSVFWGDASQERARNCLNTALWRLRSLLEPKGIPSGTYLLTTNKGDLYFNQTSEHWVDVLIFRQKLEQLLAKPSKSLKEQDVRDFNTAQSIYCGEFLEGFYENWALRQREYLRMLFLNGLAHMMNYHSHLSAFREGVAFGERILEIDPLREEIHRELMRLYMQCGQRVSALLQYEKCREVLQQELQIEPMEETRDLYHSCIEGKLMAHLTDKPENFQFNLLNIMDQVKKAQQMLSEAQEDLKQALNLVNKY